MHGSKSLQYLQMLNAAELKRLLPFLQSPFYNRNPHIVKLYRLLRREHPNFDSPKLTHERVFKKLFPTREYDHQKMLNLMSDFTALLKQYLQALQLEKEEQTQDLLLLKAYAERPECYGRFVKQVRKTDRRLEALPYRNAKFYRHKFQLTQLYLNHPSTDPFQISKEEYDNAMRHLDRWFLLEKLLLSCEMKAREKPLAESYEIWLLPELRKGIVQYPIESSIAESYLVMMDLMEKGQVSAFFQLKDLFSNNLPQFTRRQQQDILQILINFTIQRGNQGETAFVRENLELYQFGLSKQLFLDHDILNDMTYIGIVNVALRLGESEWCFQFIEQYQSLLDPRVRKDARSLASALWLYTEQRPNAAIDLLRQINFHNVYYQIQTRVLLLKIYFEAFEKNHTFIDLTLSQLEAFERYLRRNNTVSKTQREALLNFTLNLRRLVKLKTSCDFDQEAKHNLRRELQEWTPVYNRTWLLQQLDGIMSK